MKAWIEKLAEGEALTAEESEAAFRRIMSGEASEVEIAAFLTAARARGETPEMVAGGVRALREVMVKVPVEADGVVDTCGTGGGELTTFNISTVAALVTAAGGVPVAKHGNRSFTSRCGSADVLETLGVAIELGPDSLPELMERAGIVFMYAPAFHPAMRHVAAVRRELGIATMMNVLGPLTSPARVTRQVVGVADPELIPLVAGALAELGHRRALVVHGEPGLDELSPLGPTRGLRLEDGRLEDLRVEPRDFGWEDLQPDEMAGGSPDHNARVAEEVLKGTRGGAARAAVALNAAAALWAGGAVRDLEEGVGRARQILDEGAGWEALERLRDESRRLAAVNTSG